MMKFKNVEDVMHKVAATEYLIKEIEDILSSNDFSNEKAEVPYNVLSSCVECIHEHQQLLKKIRVIDPDKIGPF